MANPISGYMARDVTIRNLHPWWQPYNAPTLEMTVRVAMWAEHAPEGVHGSGSLQILTGHNFLWRSPTYPYMRIGTYCTLFGFWPYAESRVSGNWPMTGTGSKIQNWMYGSVYAVYGSFQIRLAGMSASGYHPGFRITVTVCVSPFLSGGYAFTTYNQGPGQESWYQGALT